MTRDELARIALRYDTLIAHAMLKALGIAPRKRGKFTITTAVDTGEGRDIYDCFNQRYGIS